MSHGAVSRWYAWLCVVMLSLAALPACDLLRETNTPEGMLAVTYTTIEALAASTAEEVTRGTISVDQAKEVRDILRDAQGWADLARLALSDGRPDDAAGYLQIVAGVLDQLERRLRDVST